VSGGGTNVRLPRWMDVKEGRMDVWMDGNIMLRRATNCDGN